MIDFFEHPLYQEDLRLISQVDFIPWEKLQDTSIVISGATGLIGSCLIDSIVLLNQSRKLNCTIFAICRNRLRAIHRFGHYSSDSLLHIVEGDINDSFTLEEIPACDYVLHLASNTHPVAYATDPIGTIMTNILGTRNLLEFTATKSATRFLFASSNEIYGENRGDCELFEETYSGYIDCNTLRAGYPESKRCGESLCQAYRTQRGVDAVIARLTRSFGPTLLSSDTKALSQFLRNGIAGEDIVLKSDGMQYYSYTYVADAVTGLLLTLLQGKDGEAYNIADETCDIRLRDLAEMVAKASGTSVRFDIPGQTERLGFSKATKARLEGTKIRQLGWHVQYSLYTAVLRTIHILRETTQ